MKSQPAIYRNASPHSQKGVATILIVVLVGVALTATSLGIMHSIRATQEKHVAVHAATHAQTGVWTGVEAFRRYLETTTPSTITTIPATVAFDVANDAYGDMSAQGISVTDNGTSFRVNATIINRHANAKSSAAVGVVYEVQKVNPCPGCVTLSAAVDFHDDVVAAGGINFVTPAGSKPNINVDGSITMLNISNMNMGILRATGFVDLGSNMFADAIYSNANVRLLQGAAATRVTTRGTVTIEGSGGANIVEANGSVAYGGQRANSNINSRSTVVVNAGTHPDAIVTAQGNVTIGGNGGSAKEVHTKGNVQINQTPSIVKIVAEGNLTCSDSGWNAPTSVHLNGTRTGCGGITPAKIQTGGASVTVMNEIQPFTVPRTVVDVWTLETQANYVFKRVGSENQVTVKNVSGIPNGTYRLDTSADTKLCALGTSGACVTNWEVCLREDSSACLTYETSTKTWKFKGPQTVPGVLWFDGNVHIKATTIYGTILATGSYTSESSLTIYSPNYAGYNAMCRALPSPLPAVANYATHFSDQIPTNLCNTVAQTYTPLDVANIAIAAGGYNPNPPHQGTYSGGNITLGQSNTSYGIVLAGNYLSTGGNTNIYGYVAAANQGTKGVRDNTLEGTTNVDLTKGNSNYKIDRVPDMTGGACPNCQGLGGAQTGAVNVLWSKYL